MLRVDDPDGWNPDRAMMDNLRPVVRDQESATLRWRAGPGWFLPRWKLFMALVLPKLDWFKVFWLSLSNL